MNGPEHYREAERLLNVAMAGSRVTQADPVNLAAAQVHATLALAAATAASRTTWANPADNFSATYPDGDGWPEAIS
jgi:hypothetical protein